MKIFVTIEAVNIHGTRIDITPLPNHEEEQRCRIRRSIIEAITDKEEITNKKED